MNTRDITLKTCTSEHHCQYRTIGNGFYGCNYCDYCDFQLPNEPIEGYIPKEQHDETEIDLLGHRRALSELRMSLGLSAEGESYLEILENVIPREQIKPLIEVYENMRNYTEGNFENHSYFHEICQREGKVFFSVIKSVVERIKKGEENVR